MIEISSQEFGCGKWRPGVQRIPAVALMMRPGLTGFKTIRGAAVPPLSLFKQFHTVAGGG
jgi:hypothetical protein